MQKRAVNQAGKMADAMKTQQYEVMLNYTHPKVVEMLGGNKKYLDILTTGGKEMRKMGIDYESIIFFILNFIENIIMYKRNV